MASRFEQLVATLDYPLYVVTTAFEQQPAGCLIGFATQCSIHPPRFLACISKKNHTLSLAVRAPTLAVHIIDKKNKRIAELFGGETGDDVDKFSRVRWHFVHGAPVVDGAPLLVRGLGVGAARPRRSRRLSARAYRHGTACDFGAADIPEGT